MADEPEFHRQPTYQIRIQGGLDSTWSDWFAGLTISRQAGGETVMTGPIVDQAALHGLLSKIRDLNLPLLSVVRVDPSK
jgi:hypothetical protein